MLFVLREGSQRSKSALKMLLLLTILPHLQRTDRKRHQIGPTVAPEVPALGVKIATGLVAQKAAKAARYIIIESTNLCIGVCLLSAEARHQGLVLARLQQQ